MAYLNTLYSLDCIPLDEFSVKLSHQERVNKSVLSIHLTTENLLRLTEIRLYEKELSFSHTQESDLNLSFRFFNVE